MHTDKKNNILITFGRSFLSLHLARLWSAHGHRVVVADSIPTHVSAYSNAVSCSYQVPSPRFNSEAYIDKLVEIVKKENIDTLIPVYEEITYISHHLNRFPSTCNIVCPSFDIYEKLQHKWRFQDTLSSLKIPTLKTVLIENERDLTTKELPNEFALKPCFSRASQRVFKVSNRNNIPKIDFQPHNPWVAQEWSYGLKFCTYSVCHQGALHAHATYPVNYAINGNSCINFEAIEHPKIVEWISDFVRKINFSGQIAFDFIQHDDGTLYAIECNPRATSGLLLFRETDRLDKAFGTHHGKLVFPKKGTTRQIAMGMLMYGWKKSSRQHRSFIDYIKSLLGTKDVIFNGRDLKPLLLQPLVFLHLWKQCRHLGISLPDYFTYDHDWNGELSIGNS